MELYFKDLISKESTVESLVDNLMLVVQGADEFAQAAGAGAPPERRQEIVRRLENLKDGCRKIKEQAKATALATDKVVRQYPYSFAGFAFAAGLVCGSLLMHSCSDKNKSEDQ
jgi:ElaB/YqjD/DUF883 family membrane-anchored ribosome-binding protein